MTANQIAYWNMINERNKLAETQRANKAKEAIQWDERKAENFLVPYKAAEMQKHISAMQSGRFKDVTQGIKNMIGGGVTFASAL